MNKRKGIILTLALIVVAGAAVVGSRMWKNSKHNEVNTETENASEQIAQETQEHVAGRDSSEDVQQETPDVVKGESEGDSDKKSDTETPTDSKSANGENSDVDNTTASGNKNSGTTQTDTDVKKDSKKDSNNDHKITSDDFYISGIPDDIFAKMQGKSYKDNCTVPRDDLRYVHVLHMGFDGKVKAGELVVSRKIADDVLEIFEELYKADYPIEKVRLVDEYDADDEASMSDNNSSAFNFRFISHTTRISKHGLGMAVDINTRYNPYVKTVNGKLSIEPANGADYVDRSTDFPYKIDHDDLCYKLFTEHGFTWGGDWTHSKDYQHFERDY